jgi:uncharacterized repeat protein (TIGR01451 family)
MRHTTKPRGGKGHVIPAHLAGNRPGLALPERKRGRCSGGAFSLAMGFQFGCAGSSRYDCRRRPPIKAGALIALGAVLFLLGSCAKQKQPEAMTTGIVPPATTATVTRIPIDELLPSPLPSIEPADKLHSQTPVAAEQEPFDADLVIETPGSVQILPGATSVYTLAVSNRGPGSATDVVLTDALPSNMTALWTQPAQPVCEQSERSVNCNVGALQGGDTAAIALDLSSTGTETITGTELVGVNIDVSIPICTISQEAAPPQITCRLSRLDTSAEAEVQVGFTVDDPLAGTLVHTATVTADQADPDRSNNQATGALTAGPSGPVAATAAPATTDLSLHADGPSIVVAGEPFTYTYTIANRGGMEAIGVWFEDVVPSDMDLVAYTPGLPRCEQRGDMLTCRLSTPDSSETVTLTLTVAGHPAQPLRLDVDPLQPGWPVCYVIKERTWLRIVQCAIGTLKPGEETRVQLVLVAIGTQERQTTNTASVSASGQDRNPVDHTSTITITVQAGGSPAGD